jgi:hypothetical protein
MKKNIKRKKMMINKKSQSLMEITKNEICTLRANATKQNKKCPAFPPHIWNNIIKLTAHYSRGEIIKNLSIVESQYSKAVQIAKKLSTATPAIKHQFIDISPSNPPAKVYPDHQKIEKKMILEIKTKSGNIISVYE